MQFYEGAGACKGIASRLTTTTPIRFLVAGEECVKDCVTKRPNGHIPDFGFKNIDRRGEFS